MDRIDLNELERLAKATLHPLPYSPHEKYLYMVVDPDNEQVACCPSYHSADYIVAACNAVPELIARVRELEKERFLIIHAIAGKYGRSEAVELQKFLEESKAEQTAKEAE